MHLKKWAGTGKVEWRHHNGDSFRPSLILTHPVDDGKNKKTKKKNKKRQKQSKDGSTSAAASSANDVVDKAPKKVKFQVELVVVMESLEWIPATRFFPHRSNLGGSITATPAYNQRLAQEGIRFLSDEDRDNLNSLSSLPDACLLLKIWCLQRGFLHNNETGWTEDTLVVMLLYLFRTKRASSRMAPLQLLTVFCKFWKTAALLGGQEGTVDTNTTDISRTNNARTKATKSATSTTIPSVAVHVLPPADEETNEAQTLEGAAQARLYQELWTDESKRIPTLPKTLKECFARYATAPVVLLDSSMRYNYLHALTPSMARAIGQQADNTLDCLHGTRSVQRLFLTNARFWKSHDAYLRIPLNKATIDWKRVKGDQEEHSADFGKVQSLSRKIVHVLEQALGDRVHHVETLGTGNQTIGDPPIPLHQVEMTASKPKSGKTASSSSQSQLQSATGETSLVIGLRLNRETCFRIVDRGPPPEDTDGVKAFVDLWGSAAQLRRFKDGAIVRAVAWNDPHLHKIEKEDGYVVLDSDDKTIGGIVERITRYILQRHFLTEQAVPPAFRLREMMCLVDGVRNSNTAVNNANDPLAKLESSAQLAHRSIMTVYESLVSFLRDNSAKTIPVKDAQGEATDERISRLGTPLEIDAVEPLSPCLRYSELFPPTPHQLLGGPTRATLSKKVSGVVASAPIKLQIRFGRSSKWPTDIRAMGAAKTAMLLQLATGIEGLRRGNEGFEGPIHVTPQYMDVGYKGYSWRIVVRADPELHLLRGLFRPSPEATALLQLLTKEHVIASMHHSMIHAVHTSHPASASVVRLAKRWMAAHLLSGLVPHEAIELMVAHVFTNKNVPFEPPASTTAGFLRFLQVLATHDFARYATDDIWNGRMACVCVCVCSLLFAVAVCTARSGLFLSSLPSVPV